MAMSTTIQIKDQSNLQCKLNVKLIVAFSVANTTAKPRNWATFDPVLNMKNGEKRVRRGLAKYQLHVSLWALIWRRGLVNFLLATLVAFLYIAYSSPI